MVARQNRTETDKIQIDELDRAITRELIANPSLTDEQLAKTLGFGRQTINKHRNSQAVQFLLSEAFEVPTVHLRSLTTKALQNIERLLDNPDPKIALSASTTVLKLGFSVKERADLKQVYSDRQPELPSIDEAYDSAKRLIAKIDLLRSVKPPRTLEELQREPPDQQNPTVACP